MAGSGAVAHDLVENVLGIPMDDAGKVRCGKIAAVGLGNARGAVSERGGRVPPPATVRARAP
jgi:cation/acetate symporter